MMSLSRNLTFILLFLNASPLLHLHLLIQAASTSPPVTRPRIIFMTGLDIGNDYGDDDYNEDLSAPPKVLTPVRTTLLGQGKQPCQYDSCLENQEPCEQLAENTGCLCPGVSGADEPPHSPRIKALQPISTGENRGKVEVQWCAPFSVVSTYRVVVQGSKGDTQEFQAASRRGLVGSLDAGTKVCVEAVNKAGRSATSDFSCMRYSLPESSDHNMFVGVIVGGIALLLLLIIVFVILWKYRLCQRAKRNSADGLGNPSYSTEGTL